MPPNEDDWPLSQYFLKYDLLAKIIITVDGYGKKSQFFKLSSWLAISEILDVFKHFRLRNNSGSQISSNFMLI